MEIKNTNIYIYVCDACNSSHSHSKFVRISNFFYVPEIRYCEILGGSRMGDILGHSPGPRMQQTIQNNGRWVYMQTACENEIKVKIKL